MKLIYYAIDRLKVSVFSENQYLQERVDNIIQYHFLENMGSSRGYKNYKSDSFYLSYNGNDNLIIELYPAFIINNLAVTLADGLQLIKNMLTLYDEDVPESFIYKVNRCDYCLDYIGEFKPFKNGTFVAFDTPNGRQTVITYADYGSVENGLSSYIQPCVKGDDIPWIVRRYEKSKEILCNNKDYLYSDVYFNENVIRLEIEIRKPLIKRYSKERDMETVDNIATMILNRIIDTHGDIETLKSCIDGNINISPVIESHKHLAVDMRDEVYRRIEREFESLIAIDIADSSSVNDTFIISRLSLMLERLIKEPNQKKVYYYSSKLIKDVPF